VRLRQAGAGIDAEGKTREGVKAQSRELYLRLGTPTEPRPRELLARSSSKEPRSASPGDTEAKDKTGSSGATQQTACVAKASSCTEQYRLQGVDLSRRQGASTLRGNPVSDRV